MIILTIKKEERKLLVREGSSHTKVCFSGRDQKEDIGVP